MDFESLIKTHHCKYLYSEKFESCVFMFDWNQLEEDNMFMETYFYAAYMADEKNFLKKYQPFSLLLGSPPELQDADVIDGMPQHDGLLLIDLSTVAKGEAASVLFIEEGTEDKLYEKGTLSELKLMKKPDKCTAEY